MADTIYIGVGKAIDFWNDTRTWFSQITVVQQFVLILLISCLLFYIGYSIYNRMHRRDQLRFDTAQPFITDLSALPDTTKPYKYTDVNGAVYDYLPADLFPTPLNKQFTWSFWIYVNGFDPAGKQGNDWGSYRFGEYKHILSRGGADGADSPLPTGYQYPGFWLKPTENTLACLLTLSDNSLVEVDLQDIAMNTWINVTLVLDENNIALYRNGLLEQSRVLPASPLFRPNRNVYVTNGGGFAGQLYYIQFFNSSLEPTQIRLLYESQANTISQFMLKLDMSQKTFTTAPTPTSNTGSCAPGSGSGSATRVARSAEKTGQKDLNTFKQEAKGWF